MTRLAEVKENLPHLRIWGLGIADVKWLIKQVDRIEGLETSLEIKTNFIEHQYIPLIKALTYENQKYKRTLEQVREMSRDSIIDKKYFDVVDKALKGESE